MTVFHRSLRRGTPRRKIASHALRKLPASIEKAIRKATLDFVAEVMSESAFRRVHDGQYRVVYLHDGFGDDGQPERTTIAQTRVCHQGYGVLMRQHVTGAWLTLKELGAETVSVDFVAEGGRAPLPVVAFRLVSYPGGQRAAEGARPELHSYVFYPHRYRNAVEAPGGGARLDEHALGERLAENFGLTLGQVFNAHGNAVIP
jgi:hypothetical protein